LHEEYEGDHGEEQVAEQTECADKTEHHGFALDHSEEGSVGLLGGGGGIGSGGHHRLRHPVDHRRRGRIVRIDVAAEYVDVRLSCARIDRRDHRDTDAGADIAHEVEQTGG